MNPSNSKLASFVMFFVLLIIAIVWFICRLPKNTWNFLFGVGYCVECHNFRPNWILLYKGTCFWHRP